MRLLLVLMCLSGLACAVSPRGDEGLVLVMDGGSPDADAAMPPPGPEDMDGDGLCDESEKDFGSDPAVLDTDGDGYPDLVEVFAVFDPRDAQSPGPQQVGFLTAVRDAALDFETRVTVDGMGEAYTGVFEAYPSLNAQALTAGDFLDTGIALSAEPADNVRNIDASAERFGFVMGHTRLSFRQRLVFAYAAEDFPCIDTFSFSYGVKDDLGRRGNTGDYLLVVMPEGSMGLDAARFCVPASCY